MPPPEVVAYVSGLIGLGALAYVSKRIIGAADRIDAIAITIERHEAALRSFSSALDRGRQRMDSIDKHIAATDDDVTDVRLKVASMRGGT